MAPLVPYLIVLWIPFGLVLFARWPRPVAVLAIALLGTLFLPEVQWSPIQPNAPQALRLPFLELTKVNIISYTLLLGWLVFDHGRLMHVRFGPADLPAILITCFPAVSSILNDQTANDAFAEFRTQLLFWGVPYLIGKMYLGDADGCRWCTAALAIGGLLYIPFCLIEVRMSPQLHNLIYGFQQHSFLQTVRLGGYRPMVFLPHGLAVGIFMSSATVCLFWLWRSGVWPLPQLPAIIRNHYFLPLVALSTTTVLCKSFGALALAGSAVSALLLGDRLRLNLLVWALLLVPPVYVASRASGQLKAETIIALAGSQVNAERSESLEFRVINEDKLMAAMGSNQLVGMGAGGKKHPRDHNDRPLIVDGLWIIIYFGAGAIGLAGLVGFFFVPAARFLLLCPASTWAEPAVAPAAAAAVVLAALNIDCLLNAMLNPVFIMLAGALNGWCDGLIAWRKQPTTP